MKKLLAFFAVLVLVMTTSTAFATQRGSIHHNAVNINSNNTKNIKNIDKSNTNKSKSSSFAKGGDSRSAVRNSGNSNNVNKFRTGDVSNDTKVKTSVDASSRNKNVNKLSNDQKQGQLQGQKQKASSDQDQKQRQSANNEGVNTDVNVQAPDVNIGGDNIESTYVESAETTPLVGTVSTAVNSLFGGASFSKDAKYAIIKYKMDEIDTAVARGFISVEEGQEAGRKLWKKFIKANNGNPLF